MTTTSNASGTLPRWDLDVLFPAPDSPEIQAAMQSVRAEADALLQNLEQAEDTGVTATALSRIIDRYNALLDSATRIEGYLYCLVAADVTDEAAGAASSSWDLVKANLGGIAPRFTALLRAGQLDALAAQSATIRDHLPVLERVQAMGVHLMPAGEEELAAQLGVAGAAAWSSLRDDLGGRATITIEVDGEPQEMALSEAGNFAYSPDRSLRQRADEAVNATWESLGVPLAAAINAVKGQQRVLAERRGWADPLDVSLSQNAIDRETLNAMQTAILEAVPDYQRYLRAKSRLLGVSQLAGYDFDAPVGEPMAWPYERAQEFILETFAAEHQPMADLAQRAFRENWIDAEPRQGKDGGGFSIGVGGEATRIFMNYLPVYDQMSTLAHELGHSYHSSVAARAGRTPLQNPPDDLPAPLAFPMTLAETASTFCEALAQRAARSRATGPQALSLLDSWLVAFSSTVFDTHARFLVEQQIFAIRAERELSASELTEITREAWLTVTGDAVDPATVAIYRWTKPHYFISDIAYYNYPYAFGLLFALGLLAVKERAPEGFYERLDALLADSGMRTAQDLAAGFGIDLHDPEFWRGGFRGYLADITEYERLVDEAAS
ncbi:MAG: M3 family metallopeptidase [Thermomicrobiales bacterium]